MYAMLHYFLAAGVDEDEIGDLSLDKIPNPQIHRFGLAEDAPVPVYNTCKSMYTALIANLGSFTRGRKRTAPSAFAGFIDFDDNKPSKPSKGSLISSLARSKSHLFTLCEASEINEGERSFLYERGWKTLSNRHGDILIGSRVNDHDSSMRRSAGSTQVGVAHESLPCSYMIVEIIYGKTLKVGLQGNRDDFCKSMMTTTLTRAGSDTIRACMFHLNSGIAGDKVALAHEALGTVYTDCLHYQIDLVGGDANMALYRATGRKQGCMDIRGGMYQSLWDYFLEAWVKAPQTPYMCFPKVQHVSANSLCLLKQYEDALGGAPYEECIAPDWSTFPGIDPLVAFVFEWGHSMDDDTWANIPSGQPEFKVNVSEWVLNSTSAAYLLNDRDYDSHTPLLIEVQANHFSRSREKEMNRNPDTLKAAADRRKQRQKMNKARGSTDPQAAPTDPRSSQGEASSGATSCGSQRPPEPAQPPSDKGGKGGKSSKGKESSKGKSKDKSKGKSKGKN